MITIQEVLQLLNAGDYMVSLELQDAYFHIPIHRNHKKFLRFAVQRRHYQFRVLPFGLKSAPRIFTKCLSPVATYLGQQHHQVFPYLDDWLVKAPSLDGVTRSSDACLQLFSRLGLTLNRDKSVLQPSQQITFLGATLDTTQKAFP